MTARRAILLGLSPSRNYGYVVRIAPAIVHVFQGEDVEGIGWVPHRGGPRATEQHFFGWYKHRDRACSRADELNRSASRAVA